MGEGKELKLSKFKWKISFSGYDNDCRWSASTEDGRYYLQGVKINGKGKAKENWEQFAKDNRIKYFIYV